MSIRTYRVGKGSLDELMHRVDRDLAETFVQETGFIAYQVAHMGDLTVASITLFHEREQGRAVQRAGGGVGGGIAGRFRRRAHGRHAGEVMVSRAIADLLEPAHH